MQTVTGGRTSGSGGISGDLRDLRLLGVSFLFFFLVFVLFSSGGESCSVLSLTLPADLRMHATLSGHLVHVLVEDGNLNSAYNAVGL